MIHNDTYYEVSTNWGWFRLDEGAYRDYLAGKLWITGQPGKIPEPVAAFTVPEPVPDHVSLRAVELREIAAKMGVYPLLQRLAPGGEINIPYKPRMSSLPIDEMNLSVRSSNGLMRAGASTFGKLSQLMDSERGLRGVRNLGAKSEKEISIAFISACYGQLSQLEKALFWQNMLDRGVLSDRTPDIM